MAKHADFPSLYLVDHPAIQGRMDLLRGRDLPRPRFRRLLDEVASLTAMEMTRDLGETALLDSERFLLVPILRAGLGFVPAMMRLLPSARIGVVGVVRDDKTKEPLEYVVNLPADAGGPVFIVDPMIATGGSAMHAIETLERHGIDDDRIRFLALVCAPEGLERLMASHPRVRIWAAALDSALDSNKEIVPGVGDVGNRLFGT